MLTAAGCASAPEIYHPTARYYVGKQLPIDDGSPQIETGKPNLIIDGLNHYLISLPTKLLLLNWQALDHKFPDHSRALLEKYLEMNQLRSVKIRHNEYAPIGEWKRLVHNKEIGAGYRYTLGLLSWLKYTLLPDRLFAGLPLPIIGGGDHFNPFTNTINVYSGDVTILLHEAGHSKDYTEHEWKGTSFALPRLIPGIDLLQEAAASSDAIQFLQCIRDEEDELRAYYTLIPAYFTYIGGYAPGGLIVYLPIVATGHVTGRVQSYVRARAIREEDAAPSGTSRRDFLPDFCVPFTAPAPKHMTAESPETPDQVTSTTSKE
ncbi:MAG: hypothetical protein HY067_00015 [Betaproteobacteria bacterium]|nr:hypothetical protein [Betaproteobacteria bacterium]